MKFQVALFLLSAVSLVAVVYGQSRCMLPVTWEAHMFEHNSITGQRRYALLNYDGLGERLAIEDRPPPIVSTSAYNDIFLYREHIHYHEEIHSQQCVKLALNETFRPIEIPFDAKFIAPLYIGAEEYGFGLRVDLWQYSIPGARHVLSVTRSGCILVSDSQMVVVPGDPTITRTFFDVRLGDNPEHFAPPAGCQ